MTTIKRRRVNRGALNRRTASYARERKTATATGGQFAVRRTNKSGRNARAFTRPLTEDQVYDWFYEGNDNVYADTIFDIASNYCGIKFFAAASPMQNLMVKYIQEAEGLEYIQATEKVCELLGINTNNSFFRDNGGKYAIYEPKYGDAKLVSESQLEEELFEVSMQYDEGFKAYEAMAAKYYAENPDLLDDEY